MKQQTGGSQSIVDSMVVAGVFVAFLYWVIDSIRSVFCLESINLPAALIGPDPTDIYTRMIVLCLLLLFGAHAQHSINKLRQARDTLRKSEQEHRGFVENLNVGVYRSTLEYDARLVRANRAMAAICGYPSTRELLSVSFSDLFSDASDKNAFVGEVIRRGVLSGRELLLKRKDGSAVWVSCCASVVLNEQKAATWVDGVIEDITERKLAEQALTATKEKYRQILDQAPAGICEVDLTTGRFKRVNDAMRELTGYSEHELMSMRCYDILSAESRNLLIERIGKLFGGEKVPEISEYEMRSKQGKVFWAVFKLRYHYELENVDRATIVIDDVTERKKAEKERQRVQRRLFQTEKMRAIRTLAGGIAHDFNNLLMAIQANISLMLSKADYAHPYFKYLMAIEEQVKIAADLSSQLLGFARGVKYHLETTDLNQLVREQVSLFARTNRQIRVHPKYQEDLWQVDVDRGRMKQVVLNLCVNAAQTMTQGGDLYIQTRNVVLGNKSKKLGTVKPGRYVRLSVTDTGKGMDEAILNRIFEPFFTTQKMGTQKGIGLGLTITHSIVRDHGGFIRVHSEPGRGTTFRVYLPASPRKVAAKEFAKQPFDRHQETILIVEDETPVMEVIEEMAKRLGFTVLKALSGKEALKVYELNKNRIDLVVLDIVLPDMSGGQVYEHIKRIDPNEKILISTGFDLEQTTFKDRPVDVIRKPFSLREFSEKLDRIRTRTPSRRENRRQD